LFASDDEFSEAGKGKRGLGTGMHMVSQKSTKSDLVTMEAALFPIYFEAYWFWPKVWLHSIKNKKSGWRCLLHAR
jgi:hypothetical protein